MSAEQIVGQVDTRFEDGQWHDAAELSRKDGKLPEELPVPNETLIAERALNDNFAKEPESGSEQPAQEGAGGIAAFAQQKASDVYAAGTEWAHKAQDIARPVLDAASAAKDTVFSTAATAKDTVFNTAATAKDTVFNTAAAAKDTVFNTAAAAKDTVFSTAAAAKDTVFNTTAHARDAVVDTATHAKENLFNAKDTIVNTTADALHTAQAKAASFAGLAPDLKDAADRAKENIQEAGEQQESIPKSALSDITPAELRTQKSKIVLKSDLETFADPNAPLTSRAFAAADAVAQKAAQLFETGMTTASSLLPGKAEPAEAARPAPVQAAE